jgi:hypothetical protein
MKKCQNKECHLLVDDYETRCNCGFIFENPPTIPKLWPRIIQDEICVRSSGANFGCSMAVGVFLILLCVLAYHLLIAPRAAATAFITGTIIIYKSIIRRNKEGKLVINIDKIYIPGKWEIYWRDIERAWIRRYMGFSQEEIDGNNQKYNLCIVMKPGKLQLSPNNCIEVSENKIGCSDYEFEIGSDNDINIVKDIEYMVYKKYNVVISA